MYYNDIHYIVTDNMLILILHCYRCYIDMRNPVGPLLSILLACFFLATFLMDFVCYTAVSIKIWNTRKRCIMLENEYNNQRRNSAKDTKALKKVETQVSLLERQGSAKILKKVETQISITDGATAIRFLRRKSKSIGTKYRRSLAIMLFIIAFYLFQYLPYVVYAVWALFAEPHEYIYFTTALLTNLGGVYNFVAYTYMRRSYHSPSAASQTTPSLQLKRQKSKETGEQAAEPMLLPPPPPQNEYGSTSSFLFMVTEQQAQ